MKYQRIAVLIWLVGNILLVLTITVSSLWDVKPPPDLWWLGPVLILVAMCMGCAKVLVIVTRPRYQDIGEVVEELHMATKILFTKGEEPNTLKAHIHLVTPSDPHKVVACLPAIAGFMGAYCLARGEGPEACLQELQKACLDYLRLKKEVTKSP